MMVDRACNQFLRQGKLLEIRSLQETFQLQQINKRPYGEKFGAFYRLGTPRTAFLLTNLPINACILGIFPNKKGPSFQFPKKEQRRPPPPPRPMSRERKIL